MEKVIVQDSAGSVACTYLISKVTPQKTHSTSQEICSVLCGF